jgi:uncharacterized protein YkwD
MRKYSPVLLVFVFLVLLFHCRDSGLVPNAQVDKDEARRAFEYLNQFRSDPYEYGKQIGLDLQQYEKRPTLQWNETLARVAETKALDMAQHQYFGHTNPDGNGINILIHNAGYTLPKTWLENKNRNNFESLQAGTVSGTEAINSLIVDKGIPSLGHRKHLLGVDDTFPFFSRLTDIG